MAEKELTIFDGIFRKEAETAINNLIKGTTPITEVRKRPVRGGAEVNYINTYYMTRQIALITGFRWSSECLKEKFIPNEENPREIGCLMKVTIWDKSGNTYYHQSWGSSEVKKYANNDPKGKYKAGDIISLFDDLKGAYSDGIKKCLSYFGIGNDVYGGRDLDYFGSEPDSAQSSAENSGNASTMSMTSTDQVKAFMKYLADKHVVPSGALAMLGIKDWSEVTDWKKAYETVKSVVEGK